MDEKIDFDVASVLDWRFEIKVTAAHVIKPVIKEQNIVNI
jgi:hypothetical protein